MPIVMDSKDTVNHTKIIALLHLDLVVVPFLMAEVVLAALSVMLLSHEVDQGLPAPLRLAPHQKILRLRLHLQNPDHTEKHIKTSPIIKLQVRIRETKAQSMIQGPALVKMDNRTRVRRTRRLPPTRVARSALLSKPRLGHQLLLNLYLI